MAQFDGPTIEVYVRIAEIKDRVYVDLGSPQWDVVEIDAAGWRIVAEAPVRFRRPAGLLPLPRPVAGGTLDLLAGLLNLPRAHPQREAAFTLVVGWLVAALRGQGPYPALVLIGEQGSAKSTQARALRRLIDPNAADLRAMPREEYDLVLAATHGQVLAFDNVSRLPGWLSDGICRIATGSGFATRTLYTTAGESIFSACRPVILNGVEEFVVRGDLLDRSITLSLPSIPEDLREEESRYWARFEEAQPLLLGALYDAVAASLANEATTVLDRKPRMADFAVRVEAAAPALGWAPGQFLDAYAANRGEVNEVALESSPLTPHIRAVAAEGFEGTATELLTLLDDLAEDQVQRLSSWPRSPRSLAGALRRLEPSLRAVGVEIDFYRAARTGSRLVAITTVTTVTSDGRLPHSTGG